MFAPFVVRLDHALGHQRFIRLRGKAIAVHAQIINQFLRLCWLRAALSPTSDQSCTSQRPETWIACLTLVTLITLPLYSNHTLDLY